MSDEICSDDVGKLLVWGCGEFGQHGHGHQNDISLSTGLCNPLLLGQDVVVAKVVCGSSHTVCITDDDHIYSWGNGNSGQLGIGQSKTVFQPHGVQLGVSLGTRVKGITCGTRHTFAWTDNGECYSFGNNFSAQLGYDFRKPDFKDNQPSPVYIETLFNQKVVQVACGSRHSLFLFNSGSIASVGSNDRGQLGLGSRTESVCVKNVPDMQDITVIGCGNSHCLAASGDGSLYVWGYGKACGSKEDILEPLCISNYGDRQVRILEGGDSHSMLLLDDGSLFSWGVNFEGQLGLGEHIKFQTSPAEIKNKAIQRNILSISVGENTSAATTVNGELFMWGRNVSQVFRDDEGPRYCQFYPYPVSLGSWKALKVSCGSWHVACVVIPSTKQITRRSLSPFENTTNNDLSEMLYKNENNSTSPSDYLGLIVSELDETSNDFEQTTDQYTVEYKNSEDFDNSFEVKDKGRETNVNYSKPNEQEIPLGIDGNIKDSGEKVTDNEQFTCNDTVSRKSEKLDTEMTADFELESRQSNVTGKSKVDKEFQPLLDVQKENVQSTQSRATKQLNFVSQMDINQQEHDKNLPEAQHSKSSSDKLKDDNSDRDHEFQKSISNTEKVVAQYESDKEKVNERDKTQSNESEVQKPSSAPSNVTTRSKDTRHTVNVARGSTKLRRTQSEDSSVCKTIFDLVPTKHGDGLHYSRSFSNVTMTSPQWQGSANRISQSYDYNKDNTVDKDDTKKYKGAKPDSLLHSSNTSNNMTTKQLKVSGETTETSSDTNDNSKSTENANTGAHYIYTTKQTDVFSGSVTSTQLKLSGYATGQLNREKKAPRHLRRVPSTPEYSLPHQPMHNTRHDDQLQRTQSNPNINISGQKLDVQHSSTSTPTSPPSRSHVPHPPHSSSGLPPRPPGVRRPNTQKIVYSSGSSWRRRTTMM